MGLRAHAISCQGVFLSKSNTYHAVCHHPPELCYSFALLLHGENLCTRAPMVHGALWEQLAMWS
jgi:hypothetical protein